MRPVRSSLSDSSRYAFVQKDETDGKDCLIELDGHPPTDDQVKSTGTRCPVNGDGVHLLFSIVLPKVHGLVENYKVHARFVYEAGHSEIAHTPEGTVIFVRPSTPVIGPDGLTVYPACSKDMNFEPEVAVVMGYIAKNVTVENAMDYVLGLICVSDVALRDLQDIDPTWTCAKGSGISCPLSPWTVMRDDLDWKDAKTFFTSNGEDMPMASGTTANPIHGIPEQIAATSSSSTLLPDDVIMTGIPSASGHLDPGDGAIVHVEGIGNLRNVIVRA